MTNIWLLLITMQVKDAPTQTFKQEFVKSEYCVMQAKQYWHEYYKMNYSPTTKLDILCINKKNPYEVINIKCTKEDICNV